MQKRLLVVILLLSVLCISLVSAVWWNPSTWSLTGNVISNSSSNACTDSDGGLNYYVDGLITIANNGGVAYDSAWGCVGSTVRELICPDVVVPSNDSRVSAIQNMFNRSGGLIYKMVYYSCPNGCLNGACISSTTTYALDRCNELNDSVKALFGTRFKYNDVLGKWTDSDGDILHLKEDEVVNKSQYILLGKDGRQSIYEVTTITNSSSSSPSDDELDLLDLTTDSRSTFYGFIEGKGVATVSGFSYNYSYYGAQTLPDVSRQVKFTTPYIPGDYSNCISGSTTTTNVINLQAGYNYVSLPVYSYVSIASDWNRIFPTTPGGLRVYVYRNGAFRIYTKRTGAGFSGAGSLSPAWNNGDGLIIQVNNDTALVPNGTALSSVASINIVSGYNLIAMPYGCANKFVYTASRVLNELKSQGKSCSVIEEPNAANPNAKWYSTDPKFSANGTNEDFTIDTTKAYWLVCNSPAFTWTPSCVPVYYKANWECYDGYNIQASNKIALTYDTWSKYANIACNNHCTDDGLKCGVNTLSVI